MNITRVRQERRLWKIYDSIYNFISIILTSPINIVFSGLGVSLFSFYIFDVPENWYLIISFCFVILSVYSLNLITDLEEDAVNKGYKNMENKKSIILFISVVSYIAALIIGGIENLRSIPILLIPFITGLLYSVKIKNFRLKNLFVGKNLTVSISWSLEVSLLPYLIKSSSVVFFLLIFVFIKGMINTILFDLRDVEGDAKAGVETIPVKLGKYRTLWLLFILNTSLIPLIMTWKSMLPNLWIFVLIIIYGYAYILYFYLNQAPKLLYSILVDDEWILWMLLINFL
ncbi:MAG: prenyltransferase [Thermoplasmata archaeon]|nr:MAG: prenyltransferase [Thermoplasmata archaeon]